MTPFLFAYGTLLPDAHGQMGVTERNKLQADGRFIGAARTPGVLLDLGDYPGLIAGTEIVHGGLYQLHDATQTFRWLDAYEGLTGHASDEYVRREIEATLPGGQALAAWTYVFIGNTLGLCKIKSGRWQHRAD